MVEGVTISYKIESNTDLCGYPLKIGLILEKIYWVGTKKTVHKNEVFILGGHHWGLTACRTYVKYEPSLHNRCLSVW